MEPLTPCRSALFASLTQNITATLDFEVTGIGSKRSTNNCAAQINNGGAQITSANPCFRAIASETSQAVTFSYASALGNRLRTGLITATALNPCEVTQTSPAILAGMADYATKSGSRQNLETVKAVADGSLATLRSGDLRAAVGAQHQRNTIDTHFNPNPVGQWVNANIVPASHKVDAILASCCCR